MFDKENLTFSLGGEWQECSLVDLSWRLGLYNQLEAMSDGFGVFLDSCHTSLPEGVTREYWWCTIANGVYITATA